MPLTNRLVLIVAFVLATSSMLAQDANAPDSTGLPGDNFNLKAALALFQKSNSIEEFEKMLNTADNYVNNLDLDGDGETDYIRVIGHSAGDDHAFVLQAIVSEKESQDIAVIELEKTGDTTAIVQIIGDEDIYGEQLIVEPGDGPDEADNVGIQHSFDNGVTHGPSAFGYQSADTRVVVNAWFWPSVRFVYATGYRPWISPCRWRHYPAWWRPWRPLAWHAWHPHYRYYHRHFAYVHTHRVVRAHRVYTPVRVTSVSVRTRHATAFNNYRVTRTRTTVTGPRGNKATRTTTTVRGRGGNVKARKTTVRRR